MITLKNEHLTVEVSEHGAELCSIRSTEREYLWQADPDFWARHSPVLFPIVGNVYDKTFRYNGLSYTMGQHGFARDAEFRTIEQSDDTVWLRFESDNATLEKFPAEFCLEIGYTLHEKQLDVMWRVTNPSTVQDLHFHIGAHPAFYWPTHDPDKDARGYFQFSSNEEKASSNPSGAYTSRLLVGKGCVSPDMTFSIQTDENGLFPLKADTFDAIDTIILEQQVKRVTLCDLDSKPFLSVSFEAPVVGLWSPPGRRAPFVCIEPWYGRCDTYGFDKDFSLRDWTNHLKPAEIFEAKYTIEII